MYLSRMDGKDGTIRKHEFDASDAGIYITDDNDIYLYFEMIKQAAPTHVLDVGMLLKRAGALDRAACGSHVPQEVKLIGVDFFPQWKTDIYRTIYDDIKPLIGNVPCSRDAMWLIFLLSTSDFLTKEQENAIFAWGKEVGASIVTDCDTDTRKQDLLAYGEAQMLQVENRSYAYFSFR